MIRKIWFDITNTPQVHFLTAIKGCLLNSGFHDFVFTAREFAETVSVLNQKGISDFKVIGAHHGRRKVSKLSGLLSRTISLIAENIPHDLSISCGSEGAIYTSKLKGRRSIAFGDNDKARQWTYGFFVDFAFFPDAIDRKSLERQGLKNRLYLYPGYKEDIYLAEFKPDQNFLSSLPFDKYIVVRPENIQANYILNNKTLSITPALLKRLDKKGFNVLYLPRYSFDREYVTNLKHVYMPEKALDGLNAVYYADAVLTGAGTFAREAACLGIPSFSFYSGSDLLAVDKKLIKEGKLLFSRNVDELISRVLASQKSTPDMRRSGFVKDDVNNKLVSLLNSF